MSCLYFYNSSNLTSNLGSTGACYQKCKNLVVGGMLAEISLG